MLERKDYVVRSGAVVSCILEMGRGKHSLHFVVDDELVPHAIVNIPDNEKMHIGVFHIILFYLFIYFYFFIYQFLFIYLYIYIYTIILFFLFIYYVVFFLF
jgi:hypothetical protein